MAEFRPIYDIMQRADEFRQLRDNRKQRELGLAQMEENRNFAREDREFLREDQDWKRELRNEERASRPMQKNLMEMEYQNRVMNFARDALAQVRDVDQFNQALVGFRQKFNVDPGIPALDPAKVTPQDFERIRRDLIAGVEKIKQELDREATTHKTDENIRLERERGDIELKRIDKLHGLGAYDRGGERGYAPSELGRLIQESGNYPEGSPERQLYDRYLNQYTSGAPRGGDSDMRNYVSSGEKYFDMIMENGLLDSSYRNSPEYQNAAKLGRAGFAAEYAKNMMSSISGMGGMVSDPGMPQGQGQGLDQRMAVPDNSAVYGFDARNLEMDQVKDIAQKIYDEGWTMEKLSTLLTDLAMLGRDDVMNELGFLLEELGMEKKFDAQRKQMDSRMGQDTRTKFPEPPKPERKGGLQRQYNLP